MGFFESISRGFSFIKEAYAMGFENKRLLLPSILLVLATVLYYVVIIGALVASGSTKTMTQNESYITGAVVLFGSFLISYFFMGMTVHVVDKHLKEEEFSLSSAFQDALQNFLAIAGLALVSTILQLLSNAARNAARREGGIAIVGDILMSIINAMWTIASYLLLPVIIIEDAGFFSALGRAREIHSEGYLLIGIGEVGVQLATFLTSLIGVVAIYFLARLVGGLGWGAVVFVAGAGLAFLAAFNVFVRMTYYTCLYHWAAAVEEAHDEVDIPEGPLSRVYG